MQNVSDVRQYFIDELAAEHFVTDKTGVKTIEMVAAQFVVDEPSIFGKVNEDYVVEDPNLRAIVPPCYCYVVYLPTPEMKEWLGWTP